MSTTDSDLQAGAEALRHGDAGKARELFARAVAAGRNDAPALLGLAHACRTLNDEAGKIAAIDRLLAAEPRNLRALILKADHLAASGDARSASSFYLAAVRAAPPPNELPPEVAPELNRAQQMCERYAAQYQSYIIEQLAAKGFDQAKSSRRFAQAVDIALGKKKIFLQEPRYFYFPELPQIQFYERSHFPWFDELERATDDIRAELLEVLKEPEAFAPYVQGDPNRPRKEEAGMLNNPAWSAFYLWKNGEPVAKNAARCPRTLQAL